MSGRTRALILTFALLAAVCAVVIALVGSALIGKPAPSTALRDPCSLITDDLVQRLAPGSQRVPSESVGDGSGYKECAVDLTSGTGGWRGDLEVTVSVDGAGLYRDDWRRKRCAEYGVTPTHDGPGDVSCLAVTPWDGGETRIDGWAWVGKHYQARVAYQLVEPDRLPAGAEQDLRDLLAAAVDALPD